MHPETPTSRAWFRPLRGRTRPGGSRLFCFPYAGAGASAFRNWGAGLPEGVEAFAVQLPGREDRYFDRPIADLDELLDELVPGMVPYLEEPFAFFGHSMGAIVCWELAARLKREHGVEPERIIVSGCRALQFQEAGSPSESELSDAGLIDELRRLDGTPEECLRDPDFATFVLPAFRADRMLFAGYGYRPGTRLTCPVFAFGGSEDPRVDEEHLKGWAELTAGPFEAEVFPGGHLFLNEVPERVLRSVSRALSGPLAHESLRPRSAPATGPGKGESLMTDEQSRTVEDSEARILGSLFRELLKTENIDDDASFFRLAGDSITVLKLISRARAEGLILSIADVFEYKTVRGLAERARENRADSRERAAADAGAQLLQVPISQEEWDAFESDGG